MYRSPRLYRLSLNMFHGRKKNSVFLGVAEKVGKGKSVLDVGCGPAVLGEYVDPSCEYRGMDMNPDFVKFSQEKGFDVRLGNGFEDSSYTDADVVTVCNVLHHLEPEKVDDFLGTAYKHAGEKLIVAENYAVGNKKLGPFKKVFGFFYDMIDRDGVSDGHFDHVPTKEQLLEYAQKGFGAVPSDVQREISENGRNVTVVYHKKPVAS